MVRADVGQQLRRGAGLAARFGADGIDEVGPVEVLRQRQRVPHPQAAHDVRAHLRRGRGGERQDRHLRVAGPQCFQAAIVGAEVMTPRAASMARYRRRAMCGSVAEHGTPWHKHKKRHLSALSPDAMALVDHEQRQQAPAGDRAPRVVQMIESSRERLR